MGNLSLVVQRRPGQLAVWAAGRPDSVGLVDAPDGGLTLRLRSFFHNHDFNAEFGGEYYHPEVAVTQLLCCSIRDSRLYLSRGSNMLLLP